MKIVVVDFSLAGLTFETMAPIGVIMENGQGGIELRYLPEAEEADGSPESEAYLSTVAYLDRFMVEANAGGEVDWESVLVRLVDGSYLGLRWRNISSVDDDLTIDEAYDRFVVRAEPLPVVDDDELQDWRAG